MQTINADEKELAKFSDLAHRWWDPLSEFRPLHEINPLRLQWIAQSSSLLGKTVLDVGCGGGILAEGMAGEGAHVTGIDLSDKALAVAKLHLYESGHTIDYRKLAVEALAEERPASFDIVTCMEMLEHVPDPASVVHACGTLVKPGGWTFFSTINRNLGAYLQAVVGAEYILNLLPRGTHDYERFIKPSELTAYLRAAKLSPTELIGLRYNPLTRVYSLGRNIRVNYLISARREI